ncbi:MAG: CoA-binding protein, partial [Anaerolineales bacterium]
MQTPTPGPSPVVKEHTTEEGSQQPRQDLTPLLHARSVAIVGISQLPRFGGWLYKNLRDFGYPGKIYCVNPRYESLFDQPCYP